MREAKPDLVGVAIFDRISQELDPNGPLYELKWSRREIENHLCYPDTLLAFADQLEGHQLEDHQRSEAMLKSIQEVTAALRILGRADAFGPDVKASDDFLGPVFQTYFDKLGLTNLMQKTDYHTLAHLVPRARIDREVADKLDRILTVANQAKSG